MRLVMRIISVPCHSKETKSKVPNSERKRKRRRIERKERDINVYVDINSSMLFIVFCLLLSHFQHTVRTYDGLWRPMTAYDCLWRPMTAYGGPQSCLWFAEEQAGKQWLMHTYKNQPHEIHLAVTFQSVSADRGLSRSTKEKPNNLYPIPLYFVVSSGLIVLHLVILYFPVSSVTTC